MARYRVKQHTTLVLYLSIVGLAAMIFGGLPTRMVSSKSSVKNETVFREGAEPQIKKYKCVPRTAAAKPSPRLSPKLRARGKDTGKTYRPLGLTPLCPEGQVPVPVSTKQLRPAVHKGNPLLGNIRNERLFERDPGAVTRNSLRPFKQVYWKGRGLDERNHALRSLAPVPQAACDGVAWFGSCYYYATAAFTRGADGGGMTMSVERPAYVSTGGSGHTLDEIAVQGGPGNGHIVELGWNVSSDQYGDTNPHLFVFHWNNWVGTCYDGCGWQQYSSTYFPGMDLSGVVGRQVYVGYVFYQGNWWAWFDNQWLGYFPGSEWGGNYIRSEMIQWFGEVSSSNGVPPRSDMGNGRLPGDAAAATNFTLCDVDSAAWVCWYRDQQALGSTVPAYYDILRSGFGATRFGGPGE